MTEIRQNLFRDPKLVYNDYVKHSSVLSILGTLAAASAGFLLTHEIAIPVTIVGIGVVLIGWQMIPDWWRKAFALTILAMGAGSSHISWAVQIGGVAKLAALGLLAVVTFVTTSNIPPEWAGRRHKFAIATLWLTWGLAVVSTIWSQDRGETVAQVVAFFAFIFVLHRVSTTRWIDREKLAGDLGTAYWAAFALILVGAVLALVGFPDAVSEYSGRTQGIFSNPNRLGLIAAMTVAIGIGWAINRRSPIVWISLLVPVSQVILSQSRTSIIAVAIVLLWVLVRSGAKNLILGGYLIAVSSLGLIAFSWNPFDGYFQRFSAMEGGDVLNSRTNAWHDVQAALFENPLGVGWAAAPVALDEWGKAGTASGLNSVHNSYLQLILELGIAGILPVMLIIILLLGIMVTRQTGLGIGLRAAAMTGFLVQITESAIFGLGQPYPYLFWLAIVAATVYPSSPRRSNNRVSALESENRKIVRAH